MQHKQSEKGPAPSILYTVQDTEPGMLCSVPPFHVAVTQAFETSPSTT